MTIMLLPWNDNIKKSRYTHGQNKIRLKYVSKCSEHAISSACPCSSECYNLDRCHFENRFAKYNQRGSISEALRKEKKAPVCERRKCTEY